MLNQDLRVLEDTFGPENAVSLWETRGVLQGVEGKVSPINIFPLFPPPPTLNNVLLPHRVDVTRT